MGTHQLGGETRSMLTMYQQITIKTLHNQGEKKGDIARQMGCHRNTVRNILQKDNFVEKQTRQKSSQFDVYKDKIKEWKKGDVTVRRMFEMLGAEYAYTGSYDGLCKYIQQNFPKEVEAFGVQQTNPGEEAEVDFGYMGMFPGVDGVPVKTWAIAIVLCYSRVGYFQIVADQTVKSLTKAIETGCRYFGGVPKKLKVDNMKTAIIANQKYKLVYNQEFLEFAMHYNMVVFPCEPYSPQQKGKVESGIKYLQTNFFNGRTFSNKTDMEQQLENWMKQTANRRIHGTTRKIPWEELQTAEQQQLLPLPENPFAFFDRTQRKVGINCHIHFANNYYSVPSYLVGKEVTVRFNEAIVRIVYQGEQIALHARCFELGNYVTVRNHLPDYKIYSTTEYQSLYESKMAAIGKSAHEYFTMLLATKDSYWFRSVRILLGYVKEYGNEAVEKSLKRALYYQATDISTIRNILHKKLYLLEVESPMTQVEVSSNNRDLSYYQV